MFNSGFTNKTAYKVIRPYTSQKLHFSSTLEGGASKCYREVKSLMPSSTDFSVMNMTTNELYDYKLNKLPIQQSLQNGGILPSLDMKRLEEKIDSLEKRIKTLEDKSVNNVNNNNLDKSEKLKLEKLEKLKLEKSEKLDNLFQRSEKLIQASPKASTKASPKASPKDNNILPGPTHNNTNSDFAKAFL